MSSDSVQKNGVTFECIQGDITDQHDLDVIVNAANAELMPGGGVAGAIHKAAGPELARTCESMAPISPGKAVITRGFELPNGHVIHCLGPVYGRDEPSDELLADCYRNAVQLAEKEGLESIGFPALSTGAFGYPMEPAAEVAFETLLALSSELKKVRLIRFVLFKDADRELHQRVLTRLAG
ncbi:O-acetyl-ADP-ribose deacetylase (regulator of RNase III), contains Macro domain [Marinobacter daqiaonensis]|uniref:O-acetyl-ADP-ribose deacetylase (Regulator of RNase III), contains Macro domain n=1 Tax=Marinobacter daqiaonensis TaxID=650891 RepID=A0A1I6I9R0_9GAMM|nr:macro domain-containing protein [Marinobacter daqiaonensis]SFR63421.1 O-acetyl-ADP-ribose deacetylase (regulator of RNase III), contains Macro domain [Marinobacter daqiaonensis]